MDLCRPLTLGVLLLAAPTPASPQETAPKAAVEVVRLDVVVTDPEGNLVRDLTREDFEVREDGKPQRITNFVVAGRGRAALEPGAAPDVGGAPPEVGVVAPEVEITAQAASPPVTAPRRYVVIVVDDLHIRADSMPYAKEALKRFVTELIAAEDTVGVVTTSVDGPLQQPTTERAALEQAIDRLTSRDVEIGRVRGATITPGEAELILRGDPDALQLGGRMVRAEEPGGPQQPMTPQAAVQGPMVAAQGGGPPSEFDSLGQLTLFEKEARRQARPVLAEALRFSAATLSSVEQVLRQMSGLPGRKLCLLVSDGFLIGIGTDEERTREMRQVIDAATRSGAVLYTLDARGLSGMDWQRAAVGGLHVPPGLQERVSGQVELSVQATLAGLADDTGGFLVRGTNDLVSGLQRMLEDNEFYYLLAYVPSNTRRDGRFRKLEVRLPRHADYAVRTRTGYFAPDDKSPARQAPVTPLSEVEARLALSGDLPAEGLPVRVSVGYVDLPSTGPQAIVQGHVDLAGLEWRRTEGRRRTTVEMICGVYDASGQPLGPAFSRRADLDLSPEEHEEAMANGLQYQQTLSLSPGRYEVRLVTRDGGRATLGGTREWVDIPDLAGKKLTLSSVFLSSSAPADASVASTGPGGDETLRAARALRRFDRGESLYFQLYVYNPTLDEKGESDVVLQAQIRSQGRVIAASKPQPVVFQEKDGVPLPQTNGMSLEGLAPGRYELRVVVVDRKGPATAFRDTDFTVR